MPYKDILKKNEWNRKWRKRNKLYIKKYNKNWNKKNREYYRKYEKEWRRKRINLWLSYLNNKNYCPICEVCGRELKYFNGELGVHFDHKQEDLPIVKTPSLWLEENPPTKENIKIWESCNFGILCRNCNRFLPTKDRKNWMLKALKYVCKSNSNTEF